MRLTVGSLPPAVYWRRRALVLGGFLVAVLLLTYTCSGESGAKDGKKRASGARRASASPTTSPAPSPSLLTPIVGDPVPSASPSGTQAGPGGQGGVPGGGGGSGAGPCADPEITVVPAAEATSVRQGVPTRLFIKIKNVSGRTCVRDVGADMQEIYIQQGTAKVWSSDSCAKRSGGEIKTFPANLEVTYEVVWDGKSTAQGCDNRPWMPKGAYQLHGRLGTKISEPVTLTVTG